MNLSQDVYHSPAVLQSSTELGQTKVRLQKIRRGEKLFVIFMITYFSKYLKKL